MVLLLQPDTLHSLPLHLILFPIPSSEILSDKSLSTMASSSTLFGSSPSQVRNEKSNAYISRISSNFNDFLSFSQLCFAKNCVVSRSLANPTRTNSLKKVSHPRIRCQATSVPADDRVPDMEKRQLLNLLLLGAISLPTAIMVVPYAAFFVPPG